MLERLGLHDDVVRNARSNRTPAAANRSMFGVRIAGFP
tara:strand:- start:158 stop:271 length:114 start_codon:yes stop_codon:yes gene_type:complete